MATEIIDKLILNLKQENAELRKELALTITERDEARKLATEISHMLTYAAEQSNRKGLEVVK